MSYVRWSSPGRPHDYDSAVYIYDTDDGVVCFSCVRYPADEAGDYPSHVEATPGRMIEHVRAHIAAGDAVPDFVIPGLADAERRWSTPS
ncbi:hypothetical protein HDA40_002778 [Hamadaea flava]|uniref:Uncharacterized protein n=1 Tax=Hamadaea flava TaxID=1742688 RepID=A0ABV8LGI0_9ACTN|nr:hypothetical protein [Hamadaea flava]MCP2324271.1 hypothetical protein [Hamadaea flava]